MDLRLQAEVLAQKRQTAAKTALGAVCIEPLTLLCQTQSSSMYESQIHFPPNSILTFLSGKILAQASVRFKFKFRAWLEWEKAKSCSWSVKHERDFQWTLYFATDPFLWYLLFSSDPTGALGFQWFWTWTLTLGIEVYQFSLAISGFSHFVLCVSRKGEHGEQISLWLDDRHLYPCRTREDKVSHPVFGIMLHTVNTCKFGWVVSDR